MADLSYSIAPVRFAQAADRIRGAMVLQGKTDADSITNLEQILADSVALTNEEVGWARACGYAIREMPPATDWTSARMLPVLMAHPDKVVVLSQLGLSKTVKVNRAESTPERPFPLTVVGARQWKTQVQAAAVSSSVVPREVTLTFDSDSEDEAAIREVKPPPKPPTPKKTRAKSAKSKAKVEPQVEAQQEPQQEVEVEAQVEAQQEAQVEAQVEAQQEAQVEAQVEAPVEPQQKTRGEEVSADIAPPETEPPPPRKKATRRKVGKPRPIPKRF